MLPEHDVAIVGLGPVGASAANVAGSLGLRCIAVDLSEQVFDQPRAIHFDADIMRIFQSFGVADEVRQISRAGRGSVHLGMDGEPIRDFRVPDVVGELGWSPHYQFFQPDLDQLLRDRAAARSSVDFRLGWRCDRVEQDPVGVTVHLTAPDGAPEEVRASHLVACDGASSAIRRQLGIDLFDYGFEEPWVVVDVLVPEADLGPDHLVTSCDAKRPSVYVPGPGRFRRWEFMILPEEDGLELTQVETVRELIGKVAPWLDPAEAELIRSAVYTFHGLVATSWSDRRIFLAGDAAHQTPPFYAQGMCHGIRDVRNLLWKIAMVLRGEADPAILRSYYDEREPHVSTIIQAAVENGRYICTLDPEQARRRDEEFRQLGREGRDVGSFRNVIPGLTAGLLDDCDPRPPSVGLLFPQPTVCVRDDTPRLLDEVLGDGFSLVTIGIPDAIVQTNFVAALRGRVIGLGTDEVDGECPVAWIDDPSGTLREWFDREDCEWVLLRPDRYVYGVAKDLADFHGLNERLLEMLRARRPLTAVATENAGARA